MPSTTTPTIILNQKEEKNTIQQEYINSSSPMSLEQQQLTFDITKDHHISKRPKLNEDDLLEDDDDAQDNAVDAAVDFALQMMARDQRRVGSL